MCVSYFVPIVAASAEDIDEGAPQRLNWVPMKAGRERESEISALVTTKTTSTSNLQTLAVSDAIILILFLGKHKSQRKREITCGEIGVVVVGIEYE